MGRLIDADAFIAEVESQFFMGNLDPNRKLALLAIIDSQPTAYDVEKVVAELEEHKTRYGKLQFAHNDANMVCVYVGKEQAIDCAIDIVRKGGVE